LPDGLYVRNAKVVEETLPSLTALIQRARYDCDVFFDNPLDALVLRGELGVLLSGPIIVEKHTKGGMKQVDIRPQLISMRLLEDDRKGSLTAANFDIDRHLNASGSLQN
jgi:uncharacterized protein (DUF2344 family)